MAHLFNETESIPSPFHSLPLKDFLDQQQQQPFEQGNSNTDSFMDMGGRYDSIDDDLLDLFMFYVDDVCEEKIRELSLQIKLYGLISCVVTTVLVLAGLLFFTVGLFSVITKNDFSNESEYTLEHDFSSDIAASSKTNEDEVSNNDHEDSVVKEIYTSKWNLPSKIKEKAMFWRATTSRDSCNDYGYESLIDIYANDMNGISKPADDLSVNYKSDDELDNYSNISFGDIHFRKTRNNEDGNDVETVSTEELDDYATASFDLKMETIEPIVSSAFLDTASITDSKSFSSTTNLVCFQNISLIAEEDEEDDGDDEDSGIEGGSYSKKALRHNVGSGRKVSKSDEEVLLKSGNMLHESEYTDSRIHSLNLSKIGPTYLYVYLNMIYGNWDEFEYKSVLSGNGAISEKLNDKIVKRLLEILKRSAIEEFRKEKMKEKLEILRFAYITETYHEFILNNVMNSIQFLCEVIEDQEVSESIKCEIFQIFHCSFWYESKTLLTFEFAKAIIKSMVGSLSLMKVNSDGFKDGIRCLHRVLVYSNIDDFIGELFDGCFRDVNNETFEKQNIIWELLKLVICEWMLEADKIEEIEEIYEKLVVKIDSLLEGYVEKDNSKYQEFTLIWKMLKGHSTKEALSEGSREILNENYNPNYRIKKRYNSVSKVKRKLSVTKKKTDRGEANENTEAVGKGTRAKGIGTLSGSVAGIARQELRDVTNVTKASD